MPQPQPGQPPLGGFVIPPLPPGAVVGPAPQPPLFGGQYPPGGQYPLGFVPQPPQPPVIPGGDRGPIVHTPVIPQPPPGWRFPMPDPGDHMGPVIPPGAGFVQHPSHQYPDEYIHHIPPDGDEPVIPSTPSSSRSDTPIPVPHGHGATVVIAPSHDSRSSTPTNQSYHPPHSPGAIPIPGSAFGQMPAVVPVGHSSGSPQHTPHQTIINVGPQMAPPPGQIQHTPEPIIVHGQPGMQQGIPIQPSTIVIQPTGQMQPVPIPGTIYAPSRSHSRTSGRSQAPVVVMHSSPEHPPAPFVIRTPSGHDHRPPSIHAFPPSQTAPTPVFVNVPEGSRARSRSYTPEGRHRHAHHDDSRSRPSSPRDEGHRPPSSRHRDDHRRRSRSYSPDDGGYRRREYDDGYPRRRDNRSRYSPERGYRRHDYSPEGGRRPRDYSPRDEGRRLHRRRPSGRTEYSPEGGERDDGNGRRPRPRRDYSPRDEGDGSRRDRPTGRSEYSPDTGERDGGGRPRPRRDYSPRDEGDHPRRDRPTGRSEHSPETGERDGGSGRRPTPRRDYSPRDEGDHPSRDRPTGRSEHSPETGERDGGNGRRPTPRRDYSPRDEGDPPRRDRPAGRSEHSPETGERDGGNGRRPTPRRDYSPRDEGDHPRRDRPTGRSEHSPEIGERDGGDGRRPRLGDEDDGERPHRHRPTGRTEYSPEAGDRDAGDRRRLPSSETRSQRRPEFIEGDSGAALPHPAPTFASVHPPASPLPPTIIRLGGDHADHPAHIIIPSRPYSPGKSMCFLTSLLYQSRFVDESISHRSELHARPGSAYPSDTRDRYPPRRTASRGRPPSMIAEEDSGRPPSDMVQHVPPPTHAREPSGRDDAEFENALRARQERLVEAEDELTHIIHDAHNAEARRGEEFNQAEDAREHVFRENEDRREREARERSDAIFQQLDERAASVPPIPVPPPQPQEQDHDHASIIESIHTAAQDAASRHASDILDIVREEREEMARERESLATERERQRAHFEDQSRLHDAEREAKITALEEELARVRGELENERLLRTTEENEARMAAAERDDALRNQLVEITNIVQQNQALCEEKKALTDQHWAEKQRWKEERDGQMQELTGMVSRLVEEQVAARQREEEQRQANEGKPGKSRAEAPGVATVLNQQTGVEQVLEELHRQNTEQRELLNALSESECSSASCDSLTYCNMFRLEDRQHQTA
jgi:hypothetical protein